MLIRTLMEVDFLERPVRLLSNLLLILQLVCSCKSLNSDSSLVIIYQDSTIKSEKGLVTYNGSPFTGTLLKLQENSNDTIFVRNYSEGLKNGIFKKFYVNNLLQEKREYIMGKKDGKHTGYWDNGKLAFDYKLKEDLYDGNQRNWNKDGRMIKSLNYVDGHQEGLQQIWDNNGIIRTNYVIKNNRRYGLLGVKNCINVSDSIK